MYKYMSYRCRLLEHGLLSHAPILVAVRAQEEQRSSGSGTVKLKVCRNSSSGVWMYVTSSSRDLVSRFAVCT